MLFLFSFKAFAFQLNSKPLVFSDPEVIYKVNNFVKVFQTPDTITSQEAWIRILNGELDEVPYQGNPGMTNSDVAYWLVFTVVNELPNESDFKLELSYPQLDLTSLSEIKGDTAYTLFITGDSFEFDQRPIRNRNFVFPISIDHLAKKTFLLNADKRNSAVRFPLRLYSEDQFQLKSNKEQNYLTAYYLFLVIMTFCLLLVGLGLRKGVFIWYALSVFCYGLWLFTWQGFSYKYITSNLPEFNRHFLAFCTQISVMSFLVFVQSFFNTKKLLPKFDKLMNGVLILFGLAIIIWVIIPDTYIAIAPKLFAVRYILVGLILAFSIVAAVKYRKVSQQRFILFAISYSLFFITLIGKILDEYGVISEYNFVLDPVLIGNLLQVLVLSMAMILILIKIIRERENLRKTNSELKASLNRLEVVSPSKTLEYITLKSKAVLTVNEIIYISSDGAYCEFYLIGRQHPEIDRQTMTVMEGVLPANFIRIHRSTIVNVDFVKQASASALLLFDGRKLVISRTYKEKVKDVIKHIKIG